ncbi:MAG: hypothetical protein HDQ99_13285 [Lachnospiraceae bacterium]|nr:hypothetical protein [Lachnospiraceae bacterium]
MKRKMRLFGIAVMLAMLTACGSDGKGEPPETDESRLPAEYTYEKDTIHYAEMAGRYAFLKDVEKTQTDCAAYYFETAISHEEREACIVATDRILSCIAGTLPEIEVVVFKPESYSGIAVHGNRLYVPVQLWDSVEYVTGVLLAGYGEWGNYGLAYGYANYLCREAGWDYRETAGFQQMGSPDLYDLNLLCFDEQFVLPEDVEAAKNNACFFVNEYLSAHSEEDFLKLLSDSGTVEGVGSANEVLEAFYNGNDVECSLTEIRYQYGGMFLDYAAACEYARFYVAKDWQDQTWETNPKVSEYFLHEDYSEVRAFFECNVRQMGQYQELFDFDSYNNDLPVMFANGRGQSMDSFYEIGSHTIFVSRVFDLSHEYIHSVTYGRIHFKNQWRIEGFTTYYDCQYNEYAYDFLNNDYNNPPNNEVGVYLKKYMDWIGRPIDFKTDHWEIENLKTYVYGYTNPDLTYTSGASFVGYLISQYGEKSVIAYVCSNDTYNAEWGKSYEELVQDWNGYIDENYSWYDKE